MLAAFTLFLLSFVPGPLVSLRVWWPEIVVLMSLVGMLTLGVSLLGLLLVGVASLTRLVWLLARVGRLG